MHTAFQVCLHILQWLFFVSEQCSQAFFAFETEWHQQSPILTGEMRAYHFHTFDAFEVNFNAVLCRDSNSVTLPSFNSSIWYVEKS